MTAAIVRGAGKQKVGAICNFVSFYIVGFPIGVWLMFPVKMGIVGERWFISRVAFMWKAFLVDWTVLCSCSCVAGVWLGFLISVTAQSVFFTFYLYKLNWEKASEEVRSSSTDSPFPQRRLSGYGLTRAHFTNSDADAAEFLLNRHRKELKSRS